MRVLAIPGSLRRGSYNRLLLCAAAERASSGMTIEVRSLIDVPPFNEDFEIEPPEAVAHLREQVAAADGLLIATPEYNQSIPGVLKNAIDWISRREELLSGKPAAILGATAGRWGTRLAQAALRQTLYATEALVMTTPALYIAEAAPLFDADGRLINQVTATALDRFLIAFREWIAMWSDRGTHRRRTAIRRAARGRDRPSRA